MRMGVVPLALMGLLLLSGCGDDEDLVPVPDTATTPDTSADDTAGGDDPGNLGDEGGADEGTPDMGMPDEGTPIVFEKPDYFPGKDIDGDEVIPLEGLEGPVRVVWDDRGIPHIYGDSLEDLARVQGYVCARLRLFQLHTFRSFSEGTLSPMLGHGALLDDAFIRAVGLARTAEKMAERTEQQFPEAFAVMQAFADGVNVYIDGVNAGELPAPQEVAIFKLQMPHWTVADTMKVVRLQTFDLGFGGYVNEVSYMNWGLELKEKYDGTAREGIEDDWLDSTPPNLRATLLAAAPSSKPGAAKPSSGFKFSTTLDHPFFQKLNRKMMRRVAKVGEELMRRRPFRGPEFGSNNWVMKGEHTASGRPLLANDTHLSLRNPAIFYQVHATNKLAGGDFNVAGVNFAGAPGIVLGHNDHISWGGTVFFSDVTDTYVEQLTPDGKSVMFDGQEVALVERQEKFRYFKPGDDPCESAYEGTWLEGLPHSLETLDGGKVCELTVTMQDVPHHGPIIPWSYDEDGEGNKVAMSWAWTGFEATDEMMAIWGLNHATNMQEFQDSLDMFGVGAQNWVYADTAGNIGWYPSHILPIREHIAAGNYDFPPFLPMPGDGTTEWSGALPRDQIPHAFNPDQPYLATANSDPTGISFDGDPFNDGPYIGHYWGVGFRLNRVSTRLDQLVAQGNVTPDDFSSVQADHFSNLGDRVKPHLIAALDMALSGADATAAARIPTEMTAKVQAARDMVNGWSLQAASGVEAAPGSEEAEDAAATAIMNAFVVTLTNNAIQDELSGGTDHVRGRVLLRILESEQTLNTWDEALQQSMIWDDDTTADVTETRNEIIVKSFVEALVFLENADKVGVPESGGFGTDDMAQWRWGALHTLTLPNNLTSLNDIPKPDVFPNGFPRHGDNFAVDASHPGMTNFGFTYSHGPAIRNVYSMTDQVEFRGVIPGGQSESPFSPHYADEMEHWVKNEAPTWVTAVEDVMAARERITDFVPPPSR